MLRIDVIVLANQNGASPSAPLRITRAIPRLGEQLRLVPHHVDLVLVQRFTFNNQAIVNEAIYTKILLK